VYDFPDPSLNFSPKIFENSLTIDPYYTYNVIMTEYIDPIPDDLSACQELLRAALWPGLGSAFFLFLIVRRLQNCTP